MYDPKTYYRGDGLQSISQEYRATMNDQAYQAFISHLEEQKKDVLEQLAQLDIDFQDEVRNDV